jgi:lysozyme family protein
MKQNFDKAFTAMLANEGGFVNLLSDPGGMTNLGVTKQTWELYVGHPVDEKTMRGLAPEIVKPLYKQKYWDKVFGDDLPSGVDYVVFDAAVNSGPARAVKWLQACVGVEVDGSIDPKTLNAVRAFNSKQLLEDYIKRRLSYLIDLPGWVTFGRGWTHRIEQVKTTALSMS